jgi:endonuclease G
VLPDEEIEAAVPRDGYDPNFLSKAVPLPTLSTALKRDAVNFGSSNFIAYTHFSVCLSAERRLARLVAWNVDGTRRVVVGRVSFKLDRRFEDDQHGEDLYEDNPLDRGHIARRAAVAWGTVAEAKQANSDSFFFTNIAPQHKRFNQSKLGGLWGELENLVLEQAETEDIRVSVMGGPIFRSDDPEYRNAKLPRSFWKLIAYMGADGRLRAAAFVLSQDELLQSIERLDLEPLRLYQVTLPELQVQTSLGFDALFDADVAAHPELAIRGALPEAIEAGLRHEVGRPVTSMADLLI